MNLAKNDLSKSGNYTMKGTIEINSDGMGMKITRVSGGSGNSSTVSLYDSPRMSSPKEIFTRK